MPKDLLYYVLGSNIYTLPTEPDPHWDILQNMIEQESNSLLLVKPAKMPTYYMTRDAQEDAVSSLILTVCVRQGKLDYIPLQVIVNLIAEYGDQLQPNDLENLARGFGSLRGKLKYYHHWRDKDALFIAPTSAWFLDQISPKITKIINLRNQ